MNFLNEIPRGCTLIVHSAFSCFSRKGLRCEEVIETLLDHADTLLMPTMTWRTVTPQNPVFDVDKTPSHTGVLSEVFRTHYATARSLHPTHSVAGRGTMAKELLATHHLGNTPVPLTSPYGLLRGREAYVLMIGVGLECCTAIHLPEELIAPEIYLVDEVEKYELRNGSMALPYELRRHRKLPRDFHVYDNVTLKGSMQGCPWELVDLQVLDAEVTSKLTKNPRYHLIDRADRSIAVA